MPRSTDTPKRELLVFYYKYRRRLALAFLAPFAVAVALSFMPSPRYVATGTLVVRLGSEYVYQPEIGAGTNSPASPIPFDRDQIYKAEVAILNSHDLHQQVVEKVGIDRIDRRAASGSTSPGMLLGLIDSWYPADEEAPAWVESLRSALGEDPVTRLSEEQQARRKLDLAVMRFEKRLGILLGKDSAVIEVTYQNRDREVAVQALDTLLKMYLEKRKQLYLETRTALAKNEADVTRRRASSSRAAVENFKRQHQIYSLPEQRAQLLRQRDDVRKQMMTVSNPSLDDKLQNITSQLDSLDALDREYNALEHEVQVTNDEYTLYNHKLDEAQAYDNIERARMGSVRVIQPPSAPPEPKRLQGLILFAGLILSFISTAVVAALTEFFRSGFLTPERLERNIGLPVLGVLSFHKHN